MTRSADELRSIAKEAYVYGFPMADSYRIQYSYFVDKGDPEYKVPWNQICNTARVYTPADIAVQTPNSDTPYSFVGATSSEGCCPGIEASRLGRDVRLNFGRFQ